MIINSVTNYLEAMCPVRGVNPQSLEASQDWEDWGVCNRACRLMDYRRGNLKNYKNMN
jgi:hypothetical protein